MSIDHRAVSEAVERMKAGKSADRVLSRAVRHIPGTFDRLDAYGAHLNAVLKIVRQEAPEPTAQPVSEPEAPPHERTCKWCGRLCETPSGKGVHEAACRRASEREARVLAARSNGTKVVDIAAREGIAESYVYMILRRAREAAWPPSPTPAPPRDAGRRPTRRPTTGAQAMNPGSPEAFEAGCTCPRMDNAHGRGWMGGAKDEDGETIYVISEDCPMHGNDDPPPAKKAA